MAARSPLAPTDEARLLAYLPRVPLRDQAFLFLALRTGFRACELSRLTVGHVHDCGAIRSAVTLERRHLKGGAEARRRNVRCRTVPLGDSVRDILAAYLDTRFAGRPVDGGQPLFLSRKLGGPVRPWQLNRIAKKNLHAAGCQIHHSGSHSMRKTFAHRIYQATGHNLVTTQAALGHASIMSTVSYLRENDGEAHRAILALDCCRAKGSDWATK